MNAHGGGPGLRASAERLLDDVEGLLGLDGGPVIAGFRTALRRPAVIAVAGRVNTGKSTLVNSLISAKLAPTSAQETTALLCRYVYGSPARAEAVLASGDVVPVPLAGTGPALGTIPPETVDYLQVHVQAAALQPVTIVDTPGLGSAATDNSRRTESRMLGNADPQGGPDALLYLVRDSFRPDDEEFIARFTARPGTGRGRSAVIGLVGHADNHGGGPWQGAEPVEQARAAAVGLSGKLPQLTAVLPVSALLGETVRTGALREQDVRNLRRLQGADDLRLQFAGQLGAPPEIPGEDFRRLIELIGPYGVRFGRDHCGSAAQLTQWLHERAGLAELERTLQYAVTGPAECARVDEMFTGLLAAARSRSWPAEARRLIEGARHAPAFHRLQEVAALDLLAADAPGHPMVAVLQGLTRDDSELDGVLPPVTGDGGFLGLAAHYQSLASTAATGAEAQAARVIARSMLIRAGLTGGRP